MFNFLLLIYKKDKHPTGQYVFVTCAVTEVEFQEPDELDLHCFMVQTEKERLIFATESEQDTEEWADYIAEATYPLDEED